MKPNLNPEPTLTMYPYFLTIVAAYVAYRIYLKWTCGWCKCSARMNGKTVIVTGSNTGLGFETAKEMARRGAKVILACRDEQKAIAARDKIVHETGSNRVFFKKLDLASFRSVRKFAADILKTEPALHVLVNNAGTGKLDNSLTADNLPVEAQINHFGPFLLTTLLLPLLKSSAPSRIVNVSSIMHKFGTIDIASFDKQAKMGYEHKRVYANTKLANILFTRKLSEDLKDSGVTVNCLHPGAAKTDILRNQPSYLRFLMKLFMKSPFEGAQTSIHLCVAPELEGITGKYFAECKEKMPSTKAMSNELAQQLWDLSVRRVSVAIQTG